MQTASLFDLLNWYQRSGRDLPWRHTKDAYAIWVSEIMLQQTRVEAVRPYYAAWMKKYPSVRDLAGADAEDLNRLWEGLGYYSRVRNMHKAAMEVTVHHGGLFPVSYDALLTLPGIGEYTAGAVASIAGGENVPAVDGNVLRVYTRLQADEGQINLDKTKKRIRKEIASLMKEALRIDPTFSPGNFNSAMMELGAVVCVPNGEPKCADCPLREDCRARKEKRIADFPKKAAKAARRIEERTVFIMESTEGIALRKRPAKGLLAGLYEFPNTEGTLNEKEALGYISSLGYHPLRIAPVEDARHIFSHVEWHMKGYRVLVDALEDPVKRDVTEGIFFVNAKEREEGYALPSAFGAYKKYFS